MIIGNAAGQTTTVDSERYRVILNDFLLPLFDELGLENMWFEDDGAAAHTVRNATEILRAVFPGRLISRFGDLHWPVKSPDLTVPDLFLWGFLKSCVYVSNPQTLEALREHGRHKCEYLSPEVLPRVMENATNQAGMVINSGGLKGKN